MTILRAILLIPALITPQLSFAQALSASDRQKHKRADAAADRFIERFRRTLDFGVVWKESHMSDISCVIRQSGYDSRRLLDDELLETFYVALMNYFYLSNAYALSVVRVDSGLTEDAITPKEIRSFQERSTYMHLNGKEPKTAQELEEMIVELGRLNKLYRKYMPRNLMRTAAWRANYTSLVHQDGVKTRMGSADFCVSENVKLYMVNRGLFYFYFVEESGRMRLAGLGID